MARSPKRKTSNTLPTTLRHTETLFLTLISDGRNVLHVTNRAPGEMAPLAAFEMIEPRVALAHGPGRLDTDAVNASLDDGELAALASIIREGNAVYADNSGPVGHLDADATEALDAMRSMCDADAFLTPGEVADATEYLAGYEGGTDAATLVEGAWRDGVLLHEADAAAFLSTRRNRAL